MTLAAIDWTNVIVSAIFTTPAVIAALYARSNKRAIKTPSGSTIGQVMERTHNLSAIAAMGAKTVAEPPLEAVVEALNSDPEAPVKVERRETDGEGPNGEERREP